jgi:enamine deaminase RidA (YjgF/YER057c/UK114 family)
MPSSAAPSSITFSNPEGIARPGGYSLVVDIRGPSRLILLAGQIGFRSDGTMPADFEGQAVAAFENVKVALEAVGATFADLVKLNNYLVDIAGDLATYRAVRDRYVDLANPPASTTVAVPALAIPGAVYEVEAMAVIAG